jgi:SAM-dependent methyltransferase
MRPEAYQRLAARQNRYWWHRARRAMSLALLRRHGIAPGCRLLDIGCGPGGNLGFLDAMRPELAVGLDLSPLALDLARRQAPAAVLVRADLARGLPFGDAAFDVAAIFNVLYHQWVANEIALLGEVRRVLRPSGLVIITEPAFAALARDMDAAAMGRRRYRLADCRRFCRAAGLEVVAASYFTSFGAALFFAARAATTALAPLRRTTAVDPDLRPLRPAVNEALYRAALIEAGAVARGMRIPFGTTLVCVARRGPC